MQCAAMKITYCANVRFPTEKAHGVQIAKMCEAFAELGHEVNLVVTDRVSGINTDAFSYYQIKPNFRIVRVSVPDTVHLGRFGFIFSELVFAWKIRRHLTNARARADLIYGRDERVLSRLLASGLPTIWETHTGAWNKAARSLLQDSFGVVAISNGLKSFYIEKGGREDKILVAHDGVDLKQFENPEKKNTARIRLGLPLEKRIAMYIGRLDGWKGVRTLLDASLKLPDDIQVVVIGGEERHVSALRAEFRNVIFLGSRPYAELSDNQAAADVLVLPNTKKSLISSNYTSPLKLFSYMASGRPIVASDLQSIREILDDSSCIFVTPDDPNSMSEGIKKALDCSDSIPKAARQKVQSFTWQSRAQQVISFAGNVTYV